MFLRTEVLRKGKSLGFSAKGSICQTDSDIRKLYERRRERDIDRGKRWNRIKVI